MNCLTCQQRSSSYDDRDIHFVKGKDSRKTYKEESVGGINWSGSRNTTCYDQITSGQEPNLPNEVNNGHRRRKTIDITYGGQTEFMPEEDEPKLVRSSGMRRNWSFKSLKKMRG
ncbi:hypothetical protein V6N13_138345 [Hibiscus sabdariffa]|uniref:Uncharacterized protein n=1 Tax=Hibiscus sabdariffa TaxID=183260 RepID=A0ABR2QD55_9ROSI